MRFAFSILRALTMATWTNYGACLLLSIFDIVAARPRGKRKPAEEVKEGLFVLAVVFMVILAVPVLLTAYRMYYDPLTPHLWRVIKKYIRDYFSTAADARREIAQTKSSREIATEMYRKSMAQRSKAAGNSTRRRPTRPLNPPQRPPSMPLSE